MKKVSVVGRGTAGVVSMLTLLKAKEWSDNSDDFQCEIDWHFDPNIKTQPVGEGANLWFMQFLDHRLHLDWEQLVQFDASPKQGIYYHNWGKKDYFHDFSLGTSSIHFNAVKFQEYMLERFANNSKVNIIESNITSHDQVDGNFVIDCTGRPKELTDEYIVPDYIPVNSVHVTQCYWHGPTFYHTKTIARPYGWVFLVPLNNRCSVGYLYNKSINTLDDIKLDVQNVFDEYNLTPSVDTNSFSFLNYHKEKIFDGRSIYNGNKAFFLEPMEATSIDSMLKIQSMFLDKRPKPNEKMHKWFKENEFVIMMHYAAGTKWNTHFWEYAQDRGIRCFNSFKLDLSKDYGTWGPWNLRRNLIGLGFL
jgi:tryptophan 7-halogenase